MLQMDTAVSISQAISTESPQSNRTSESWPGSSVGNVPQMINSSPPAGDTASSISQDPSGSASSGEIGGDAEGVWSIDIDQAFQEALAIYPPCGRRKIIISDEGKMYGRNELIARYIKLRCGKTRTRKQVSSHIQVLARKQQRESHAKKKGDPGVPGLSGLSPVMPVVSSAAPAAPVSQPQSTMTAQQQQNVLKLSQIQAQIPQLQSGAQLTLPDPKEQLELLGKTAGLLPMYQHLWQNPFQMQNTFHPDIKPFTDFSPFSLVPTTQVKMEPSPPPPAVQKSIASSKLTLNGFTGYVEAPNGDRVDIVSIPKHVGELESLSITDVSDKYPPLLRELFATGPSDAFFLAKCWANVHFDTRNADYLFSVDSYYTSQTQFDISVSTKVCSFGNEVVEKVEVYPAEEENGHYAFRLEKSPMCEYMVKFITELKKLDSETWMNNVLENFTVLQVVTDTRSDALLMVLCFVFEVNVEPESMCSVFRLTT